MKEVNIRREKLLINRSVSCVDFAGLVTWTRRRNHGRASCSLPITKLYSNSVSDLADDPGNMVRASSIVIPFNPVARFTLVQDCSLPDYLLCITLEKEVIP